MLSAGLSSVVCAQTNNDGKQDGKNVSDTLLLKEVVVKGERVNTSDNTLHFLPTQAQKESSRTGYGLLSRLALPYVTVNEVTKSITVPPNMGQLQIRINDVVADKHDLIALNPKTVRRVDFLQNPGARYGTDVSFVVNIVTDKAERGYAVGVDAMQTITSMRTSEDVFAKVNRGKSEFGVNYSFGYSEIKKQTYEETADYLMPDNTVHTISRTDVDWRSKNLAHALQLQYVLADSLRYTLQATLGSTLSRVPRNTRTRTETYGGVSETLPISSTDETKSALADLYFNYNLTKRQSLTAYATASYILMRYNPQELVIRKLKQFTPLCTVTNVGAEEVNLSLYADFSDFEDAMQYHSALKAGASEIITRNKKDFCLSSLPVYTPDEYLSI